MSARTTQQLPVIVQKLTSANEQAWLTLGSLAEMMADWERAMTSYEYALRHNPFSVNALTQIASLCRGREQFAKAVEYFKRILAIQETSGDTWSALGHCYLMMENLQDAYNAYQQALYHLSNPKDPKLWYGIGILYDRYGSIEHAEEAFSAVMKMDPDFEKANEIYFRLGIIYKQQQKYDLSLQCFRYIFHNPPRPLTEVDIWFQTGHVYEQQKEYELAKDAYERVLADNPDHAKVLQQLGWIYHQPNTSFSNQAQAVNYLARSLKADGNDAQSWYLLGRCYMAEQNYNKAYEAYQQAVYRDARNPTFWCSIGVLYYQINQYRDALDAYSRAIRLNPYISEVWYDLGTLYESCSNQAQDALDAYQRASELDPNNPHIRQRLDLLRKTHGVANSNAPAGLTITTPVPQDVHNPYQYGPDAPQTGHGPQFAAPPPLVGGLQSRLSSKPKSHDRRPTELPRELPIPGEHRTSTAAMTSKSATASSREHAFRVPDISGPTPTPHERLPHMDRPYPKGMDVSRASPPLASSSPSSARTHSPPYTTGHPPRSSSSSSSSVAVKVERSRTAHDENAAGTLISLAQKVPDRRRLPSSQPDVPSKRPKLSPISTLDYESSTSPSEPRSPTHASSTAPPPPPTNDKSESTASPLQDPSSPVATTTTAAAPASPIVDKVETTIKTAASN